MNYLKTLSIAFAAALLFVSCEKKGAGNEPVNPNVFTLENVRVEFTVDTDDETVGVIKMMGVKFAETMPLTLDMTIAGVGVTSTADGYSISGDGIVPTAMMGPNETPFPQYTITKLNGTATAEELTFEMLCGGSPVDFTGTVHATDEGAYIGTLSVETLPEK